MSFRLAVFGGLAALVYIIAWLMSAGMSLAAALMWSGATIVVYIGVARIVSESGLPYVRAPLTPQSFTLFGMGTANLSSSSMTMIAFSYALFSQGKGLFMTPFMHGAKLASQVKSARRMVTALLAALVVGIIVCLVMTLVLGYTMGAFNFQDYPFSSAGRHMYRLSEKYMLNDNPADLARMAFFGIGAVVMIALFYLRAMFPWWPLSPLGLTVAATYPTTQSFMMIFMAWAIKGTILKLGGVTLYNRSKPLFLGMICGYAMGVAFSFFVDWIWFPGVGHGIHSW